MNSLISKSKPCVLLQIRITQLQCYVSKIWHYKVNIQTPIYIQFLVHSILSFQIISFVILVFYSYKINSQNSTRSFHNHRFLNHWVLWLYDTWCYHTNLLTPVQVLHIRTEVQLDQSQLPLYLLHTFYWLTQTNKSETNFHSCYINTYGIKLSLINRFELQLHVLAMISHYQVN
jgi:hypothetical protein